jgi:protein phosphatase PTC6
MTLRSLSHPRFSIRIRANLPKNRADYHDYIRFQTEGKPHITGLYLENLLFHIGGIGRIPLVNPKVIGIATSRGNRAYVLSLNLYDPAPNVMLDLRYQQDFYGISTLSLDLSEIQHSLKKSLKYDWDPTLLPDFIARQVHFIGIFDGHGGSTVSQFCRQEFHALFENANKSHIPELYAWIQEIGGYFKRFKGGVLAPWIANPDNSTPFDLEARATTAFFEVRFMIDADSMDGLSSDSAAGRQKPIIRKRSQDVRCYCFDCSITVIGHSCASFLCF